MSIDCCSKCSKHIDTDFAPEVYREEFNDECLCDRCYDERMKDYDGAPYCQHCGALTEKGCKCGPIATNN